MASMNHVMLIGNLTRDPETRQLAGGSTVGKLGLAVNRRFKTRAGEAREETCFVDVDVFGRQAETAAQYLSKGRPVLVEGRLRQDQWTDRNTGQKMSRLVVVAQRVQFLGTLSGGSAQQDPGRPGAVASDCGSEDAGRDADSSAPF